MGPIPWGLARCAAVIKVPRRKPLLTELGQRRPTTHHQKAATRHRQLLGVGAASVVLILGSPSAVGWSGGWDQWPHSLPDPILPDGPCGPDMEALTSQHRPKEPHWQPCILTRAKGTNVCPPQGAPSASLVLVGCSSSSSTLGLDCPASEGNQSEWVIQIEEGGLWGMQRTPTLQWQLDPQAALYQENTSFTPCTSQSRPAQTHPLRGWIWRQESGVPPCASLSAS